MTYYPLNLLLAGIQPVPLFGQYLEGEPHLFDLSSQNDKVASYDTNDYPQFQQLIFDELAASGKSWGVARYLEERRLLLSRYPQMIEEDRIYHVGLDIVVPPEVPLFAPIDGVVHSLGLDGGAGNYGGYVCLAHDLAGCRFYSFYGHLNTDHVVAQGQQLTAGTCIGKIGAGEDSGGWFTHTHLQIITELAMSEGRDLQGYIHGSDLNRLEQLFPSPYPLFRVR